MRTGETGERVRDTNGNERNERMRERERKNCKIIYEKRYSDFFLVKSILFKFENEWRV